MRVASWRVAARNDRLSGRLTVERPQQLSDARQGDELLAVQVASDCFQTWTILGGLAHAGGKRALHTGTAARTLLHLRLMFCHFDAGRWDIEYLPFHMRLYSYLCQRCLAVRAIRQPMNDDMLRLRHLHQGAPFVPALPTTWPLARTAQTLSSPFLQTIAAGWLATIVTVFRQFGPATSGSTLAGLPTCCCRSRISSIRLSWSKRLSCSRSNCTNSLIDLNSTTS